MRLLSSLTVKLVASLVLAAGAASGCGAGGAKSGSAGVGGGGGAIFTTSSGGGMIIGAGGNGGSLFNSTTGTGPMAKLEVLPATLTITVQNGVVMPASFSAELGMGNPVDAAWQVDLTQIASVDGMGKLTPTGNVGGQITLTATFGGQKATAKVTVDLKKLLNPGGVSGTGQTALRAASAADAATQWAYPYDGTVFPKGLLAPEMMWNGGGAGDSYYVHFTGKYIDFEVFTGADPPSRYTLDGASWTELTESGDGPVKIHVARQPMGAATAAVVIDHTWTIASGSLRGIVYYWANSLGRVLRIKPGAVAPDDFLATGGDTTCSTCHAVSADGSTMLIGGDATISTWDLKTNAPVFNINPGGASFGNRPWAMAAISPDGSVMVENNAPLPGPPGGSDGMFDTHTGARMPNSGLDGVVVDMPSFGADGSKLAYVDHTSGNLGYYTFDPVKHEVSNPTTLVTPGANPSVAWPTVSPDAKWVVYARGALDSRTGPGDLYMASILNPGVDIRLAGVDGDTYPFAAGARDQHYNYEPTFAPLNAGGYAWVAFTSRRTYGNRLVGDPTVTKQIRVTALDQNPAAGADPSHPAFWVTGQDQTTLNMRAFWALSPCLANGMSCDTGSECCNQDCTSSLCSTPVANQCSQDGNHCNKTSDCCNAAAGTTCINHICSEAAPN